MQLCCSLVCMPRSWSATYKWTITAGNVSSVPEPSTLLLLNTGALGFVGLRRKKKQ